MCKGIIFITIITSLIYSISKIDVYNNDTNVKCQSFVDYKIARDMK